MSEDKSLTDNGGHTQRLSQVRHELQHQLYHRSASLSEVEKTFLSMLLVDEPSTNEAMEEYTKKLTSANKVLTNDILFSVPFEVTAPTKHVADDTPENQPEDKAPRKLSLPPKIQRLNPQLELWKAHQDGVTAKQFQLLRTRSSSAKNNQQGDGDIESSRSATGNNNNNTHESELDIIDNDVNSNCTLRTEDNDDNSSWSSSQGGFDHYDTWQTIKDEYAKDFGFDVATDNENQILKVSSDDTERGMFKILGTNADDARAAPHVLSPPLMESLLNFVPERLMHDNLWLKFSLIRDGASLDILKKYCRAAKHTILAIETTNGEVFGSFTSAPWSTDYKYFGTGESFLWRMRHNRSTPAFSLFEQAKLESEIDVFPFNGSNTYIQLCTRDKLALGGGSVESNSPDSEQADDVDLGVYLEWSNYGFGLALDELLLHGTTSPCATFGNGNLLNNGKEGELFDVMNLEVWTFTSAQTEKEAERSEMMLYFVGESSRASSMSGSLRSVTNHSGPAHTFSSEDFDQDKFYRRIGQNEDDTNRAAASYSNMMNPTSGNPYTSMRDRNI